MADNPDNPRVTITVRIPCECGRIAAIHMTPENALQTATALQAAVAGLPQVSTIVTGRDS